FLRRRPVRSYFQRPSTIATCLYSFRFLFLAPGHRRALHSFPTRRSSDLLHDRKLDALEDLIEAANGKPVLVMYNYQHDLTRIQQDRKSTRLNSSHVSISYAVFCLKKKKDATYKQRALIPVALLTVIEDKY